MLVVYGRRSAPSGKALARELGVRAVRLVPNLHIVVDEPVLRWGVSYGVIEGYTRMLNPTWAIMRAADKRLTFATFDAHDVPTVPWTTDPEQTWSGSFLARTACSFGGRGITICEGGGYFADLPVADLYTAVIQVDREYRVHVVGDRIVRCQVKVLRDGLEAPTDPIIRNWSTGYVFKGISGEPRRSVARVAVAAVKALGLNYGAVDVGWRDGSAFVFEVNTAPKMSPLTLRLVAAAIKEYADA